jgi:hypothetical protein
MPIEMKQAKTSVADLFFRAASKPQVSRVYQGETLKYTRKTAASNREKRRS